MAPATRAFMPQHEVAKLLQGLIALNVDGAKGSRQAAAQFSSTTLSHAFLDAADTRESFARELQAMVAELGGTPTASGTAVGNLHRWWMGLRGRIAEGEEYPMLAEADRGERAIRCRYEEALEQPVGGSIHALLSRHYDSIRRTSEMISGLRRSAATA